MTHPSVRTRRARLVYIALCAVCLITVLWLAKHYEVARLSATLIAVVPAAPGLYLAWKAFHADRVEAAAGTDLARTADQLAVAVRQQWEAEARLRRIDEPHPLPVRWRPAASELAEEWSYIVLTAEGWPGASGAGRRTWAGGAAELAGGGAELPDVLSRVPTGRLVVLGEPGSGKTVLLSRLVLNLLQRRPDGGCVPVLLPIASWDPGTEGFRQWMAERLMSEHPALRAVDPTTPGGSTQAMALMDRRLVLPVLDGLDEMPAAARATAISRLNDTLRPGDGLVLSCRTAAYREATTPGAGVSYRMRGAAAVELLSLAADDIVTYLRRDSGEAAAQARWLPVFSALGADTAVAAVLRNPLMLSLARTIYNPRPGETSTLVPDPAELDDTPRFGTPAALRAHLLESFLAAVYRDMPGHPSPWTVTRAERTLGLMARVMYSAPGRAPEFVWWELPRLAPRMLRSATLALFDLVAVVCGVTALAGHRFGLAAGAVNSGAVFLYAEYATRRDPRIGYPLRGVLLGVLIGVPVTVLGAWLTTPTFGCVVGALNGVLGYFGAGVFEKRTLVPSTGFRWTVRGSVIGASFGLLAGMGAGLVAAERADVTGAVTVGVSVALLSGIGALVGLGLGTAEVDLEAATDPFALLDRDRRSFLYFVLIAGLCMGGAASLAGFIGVVPTRPVFSEADAWNNAAILGVGIVAGLGAGAVGACMKTVWGNFFVAKCVLVVRRRIPLRFLAFLRDAHEKRGVLRQAGAAYQFRHLELQRRLSAGPAAGTVGSPRRRSPDEGVSV